MGAPPPCSVRRRRTIFSIAGPDSVELRAGCRQACGQWSGRVDEQTRLARLAIRETCPEALEGPCRRCGCPVAKKTMWASEAWPASKWRAVEAAPRRVIASCAQPAAPSTEGGR
jgi:hypothetical protein